MNHNSANIIMFTLTTALKFLLCFYKAFSQLVFPSYAFSHVLPFHSLLFSL